MKPGTPREWEVELGLDDPEDEAALRRRIARKLKVGEGAVPPFHIVRRSIDARRSSVRFRLRIAEGPEPALDTLALPRPREVQGSVPVIIVGDGPAGMFCAYQLARAGIACEVLDRGKPVQPRRRDLAGLTRRGVVDSDSNYCFGEGGAGTYSDGKLYTRADKRGDVSDVLEILAFHGAPRRILTDARPHVGSNKLPRVVTAMREALEACGVKFRFGAHVSSLGVTGAGTDRRVTSVRLRDGTELEAKAVVLATGHSARDVHTLLLEAGVTLHAKPFALGVRIEHPQPLINRIQYGRHAGHEKLPAAPYRLAATVEQRGVFSFCMCPGGWIVPASTEPDGLVVNGMSLSRRDSPYANSGLVVAVDAEDVALAGESGPLGGVALQRRIEQAACTAGGGALRAPATRVSDFVAGRASTTVPDGSYMPGFLAGDLRDVLDVTGVPFAMRLREALQAFGRQMRGYVTEEAVLVGVESRTSSPVRVPRDPASLASPDLAGLYPCGEGAGYAGGIVSAALDGMVVANRIVATVVR